MADEEPVVDESAPAATAILPSQSTSSAYIGKLIKHDIRLASRLTQDSLSAPPSRQLPRRKLPSDLLVDLRAREPQVQDHDAPHRQREHLQLRAPVDIVKMLVVYHDRDFANFAEIEKTIEDKLVEYDEQMKEQQKSRVDKKSATPAP